jgi:hypothetical protein
VFFCDVRWRATFLRAAANSILLSSLIPASLFGQIGKVSVTKAPSTLYHWTSSDHLRVWDFRARKLGIPKSQFVFFGGGDTSLFRGAVGSYLPDESRLLFTWTSLSGGMANTRRLYPEMSSAISSALDSDCIVDDNAIEVLLNRAEASGIVAMGGASHEQNCVLRLLIEANDAVALRIETREGRAPLTRSDVRALNQLREGKAHLVHFVSGYHQEWVVLGAAYEAGIVKAFTANPAVLRSELERGLGELNSPEALESLVHIRPSYLQTRRGVNESTEVIQRLLDSPDDTLEVVPSYFGGRYTNDTHRPKGIPKRDSIRFTSEALPHVGAELIVVPQFPSQIAQFGVGSDVNMAVDGDAFLLMRQRYGQSAPLELGSVYVDPCSISQGNCRYLANAITLVDDRPIAPQRLFEQTRNLVETIERAVETILEEVARRNIKSAVIPALGVGKGGLLTYEESAKAVLPTVHQYLRNGGSAKIVLSVPSDGLLDFERVHATYIEVAENLGKSPYQFSR